ncbi:hypothetical protein Trydic_g13930 [Trypoxylus dichotomus]
MTNYVIGIDLGTTHSCVGVYQFGKVEIIANDHGLKTTPSWVAFNSEEELVGHPAKWQASQNPENTIYDIKRLIGRHFDDEGVQSDIKSWPFKVISDDGLPKVMVRRNNIVTILSPEEISAMILTKMKHTAEAYLETSIEKAVITVPAFFSESQRKATLKAAEMAGLEVKRLLNEPTAAAIAYVTTKEVRGTVLVFDLGGGTLDVSILTVSDTNCRVRATSGNTHLGGQDFSNKLLKHMINICGIKYQKDIRHNKRAVARLMRECEEAKTKLSFVSQVKIFVDCLVDGMDFCENITAAKFNEINSDLFNATLQSVIGAIKSAGLAKEEIDKVIMVGGSSRIPKLQSLLKHFFDKDVYMSINPDEAIAYGATVYAVACSGVNSSDKSDLIIQDIIPMSLGIGTGFDDYSVVIPKNSFIPISTVRQYVTQFDNQRAVEFLVYEGEAPYTKDNIFLDKFCIYDVPPRPRGKEEFDVTFIIDINGILTVTARNISTGKEFHYSFKYVNETAEIAGLEVVRLLNELIAAAIAYAAFKEEMIGTVLEYDLGGGTVDVSILTVTDTRFRVRATHGHTHLGGQDFTNNLLKHMINKCKSKYKKDITHNRRTIHSSLNAGMRRRKNHIIIRSPSKTVCSGIDIIDKSNLIIEDIIPMSFGIAVDEHFKLYSVVIPKNFTISVSEVRRYVTFLNNQTEVAFPVYEGEACLTKDNIFLDKVCIYSVPPRPRGEEKFDGKRSILDNGILLLSGRYILTPGAFGHLSANAERIPRVMYKDGEGLDQPQSIGFGGKDITNNLIEHYTNLFEEEHKNPFRATRVPYRDYCVVHPFLIQFKRFAMTTHVIGIDLGTTYSCVGVYQNGKVEIIANDHGSRTTPSWVAFNEEQQFVGHPAKYQAPENPENTIYDIKRLVGRHFDDKSVQSDIKGWPFKVISDNGLPKVIVRRNNVDTMLSPEEISTMILTKMKHTAEAHLETNVKKAVITVPAFFSESQRKATLKAAEMAGLEVIRLLNEPTAAAIAYATMKEKMSGTVLVYDLGGGTLDISILALTDTNCRVRATFGNTHLGGQDFSNNLLKHMINICSNKYKKDITHNKRAIARLMRECESAKTKLSFASQVKIFVDCLIDGMDFSENISAAKFNEINSDLFDTTLESVAGALKSARLTKDAIDKIIMVGGSSRIPKLRSLLQNFFDKDVYTSINPDEAIAYGATLYAAVCSGVDITDKRNLIIEDIIPMSLGIGTGADFENFSVVIPKNSPTPISKVRRYVTSYDNQTEVVFPVYEGESPNTKNNIFLDKFCIYGVPPRSKCEEKFEVTFTIDVNGILRVTARNISTGNEVSITSTRKL